MVRIHGLESTIRALSNTEHTIEEAVNECFIQGMSAARGSLVSTIHSRTGATVNSIMPTFSKLAAQLHGSVVVGILDAKVPKYTGLIRNAEEAFIAEAGDLKDRIESKIQAKL